MDQAACLRRLGSNAAACHPILWSRIRRRQAEGASVIVVDPRRTDTAAAADVHLPVRPGSDLPLLNAMLAVLARDGLLDERFLARRTEGLDEALAAAAEWSPERAAEACAVRAVWVVGTNPVVSQPDAERFAAALREAELVVVQDAYHPTETGALAHVALPAAQWPEKDGTMTNSERRVSLVQRALDPPGLALADWEIFARLGRALGHREAFAWGTAAEVFDEYAATTAGRLCDVSGLSHDRLRREGPIQWPCRPGHGGTERLYSSGQFPTPSGRARLAATPHTDPADAPDDDFPLVLTTGRLAGQW